MPQLSFAVKYGAQSTDLALACAVWKDVDNKLSAVAITIARMRKLSNDFIGRIGCVTVQFWQQRRG